MSPATEKRNLQRKREEDKWNKWDNRVRDLFIWMLGAADLINQFFFTKDPSEVLILAGFAVLGIPIALEQDKLRRLRNGGGS